MALSGVKENPRILLLAGGIEFQRADLKLSSMDTLIEQENKFMEILVDKIMSLRPGTSLRRSLWIKEINYLFFFFFFP
jgi:hypothetical protein